MQSLFYSSTNVYIFWSTCIFHLIQTHGKSWYLIAAYDLDLKSGIQHKINYYDHDKSYDDNECWGWRDRQQENLFTHFWIVLDLRHLSIFKFSIIQDTGYEKFLQGFVTRLIYPLSQTSDKSKCWTDTQF